MSPISAAEAEKLLADLAGCPALVLAVSGGPDSTALMFLAARWRAGRKAGPRLLAVTVDHGLRRDSAREAAAVKRLARKLGVAHETVRWTGKKPLTRIQERARAARYRLLAAAARKAGAAAIVTAHTREDQAETVLLRLCRGSGLAGLAGMARSTRLESLGFEDRAGESVQPAEQPAGTPASGAAERARPTRSDNRSAPILLVRPFLDISKARLIATLKAARIPFAEDPSNRDPRFTRVRLRRLMPRLAAEGLDAARLVQLSRRMARANAALEAAVDDALLRLPLAYDTGAGLIALDARGFARLPAEIALRVLGKAIGRVGDEGPVEFGKLEVLAGRLADWLAKHGEAARFRRTLAGALVTCDAHRLVVARAPARRRQASNDGPAVDSRPYLHGNH